MAEEFKHNPSDQEHEDGSQVSGFHEDTEHPTSPPEHSHEEDSQRDYRKPFLARMMNRAGVETSHFADMALDWLQVLLIAGLLAWFVMSYAMVRMRVPTPSMEPTILVGDSFFVDKLTYGLGLNEPEPGDIIVFWHTHQFQRCREHSFLIWHWGQEKPCKERFVKRLIAKGPAEVAIRQGSVYVDGTMLSGEAFNRDYVCNIGEASRTPADRAQEGCSFSVPEEQWFVLGDNTPSSNDSRYWGSLNRNEFIGAPFFRVWPLSRLGPMNGYFGTLD